MDKNLNKNEALNQNLIDSGCTQAIIDAFFFLYEQGKKEEVLRLLKKHRTKLLENLQDSQKKMDCLDYLIFNLKQ